MKRLMLLALVWVAALPSPAKASGGYSVYFPVVRGGGNAVAVEWGDAEKMIWNCAPDYVIVFHYQRVQLVVGATRHETTEPYINAAIDIVRASGCNTPIMAQ